jgi:hypothetical protein
MFRSSKVRCTKACCFVKSLGEVMGILKPVIITAMLNKVNNQARERVSQLKKQP